MKKIKYGSSLIVFCQSAAQNDLKLIWSCYLLILMMTLGVSIGFAQQKIEYQLCGQDFRSIEMHDHLPAGAVYSDTLASPADRARDVIKRLNFEEKLKLTGGWDQMHFPGIPQLGIPPVYFSDASQGIDIRNICIKVGKSTAFPSELTLAATWNASLAYDYAKCIGEECQAWGINVLLGPGLNMYRNSEGGRNFEYMGEDPWLTSVMAVHYVEGLQSTGTMATLKHFIGNEQEFSRHMADVQIGERALHEIYLPPFEACIKQAHALAVMTGNNFVNGYPGAADKPLSENVLRQQDGFKGIIMSDWASSLFWPKRLGLVLGSGQSLLMSDNDGFSAYIRQLLKEDPGKKNTLEQELDSMVFYNLYAFFKDGIYDRPYRHPAWVAKIESHRAIALKTAEQGITLLKNEGHLLPLDPARVKKIAVVGPRDAWTVYTGTGSGRVIGYDPINYLEGLKNIYGDQIIQDTAMPDQEIRSADVVLYFIRKPAGEGHDVPFELPGVQKEVARYARLNKNLIVIYSGGNGIAMPWISNVKGLIMAYLPGQEGGEALANIISGKVNPSGRLPFTIEKDFRESPAWNYNKMPDGKYYWGGGKPSSREMLQKFGSVEIRYTEGIYIGYRWYDKMEITPQFPFGFGLSYTSFQFSQLKSSSPTIEKNKPVMISFTLKNTGDRDGAEVAQLYLHAVHGKTDRPPIVLKGFRKIFLKAGEHKRVSIPLGLQDLAYWDPVVHGWKEDHGKYIVEVGASSRDLSQQLTLNY